MSISTWPSSTSPLATWGGSCARGCRRGRPPSCWRNWSVRFSSCMARGYFIGILSQRMYCLMPMGICGSRILGSLRSLISRTTRRIVSSGPHCTWRLKGLRALVGMALTIRVMYMRLALYSFRCYMDIIPFRPTTLVPLSITLEIMMSKLIKDCPRWLKSFWRTLFRRILQKESLK